LGNRSSISMNRKGKTEADQVWQLQIVANEDLIQVIKPLFDANPFVLSKRAHNWKLLRQVIEMLETKEAITATGLAKTLELKNQQWPLGVNSSFVTIPVNKLAAQWVTGFTDSEGCFTVSITRNSTNRLGFRVVTRYLISQEPTELATLEALKAFLIVVLFPPILIKTLPLSQPKNIKKWGSPI
jgi:hypothetical protein